MHPKAFFGAVFGKLRMNSAARSEYSGRYSRMLSLLYARLDLVGGNSLALFHVPNLLGSGSLPFRSVMPKSNQVSEEFFALTCGEAQGNAQPLRVSMLRRTFQFPLYITERYRLLTNQPL
jgi:hypothetical protein